MVLHLLLIEEAKSAEIEQEVKERLEEALRSNEKIRKSERWVGKAQALLTRARLKYLRFRKNQNSEESRKRQLNQTIQQGVQALNTTTDLQHTGESLVTLNIRDALSTFYLSRYDTYGDADDLKTAERYARKCVKRFQKECGFVESTYLYPRACNFGAAM